MTNWFTRCILYFCQLINACRFAGHAGEPLHSTAWDDVREAPVDLHAVRLERGRLHHQAGGAQRPGCRPRTHGDAWKPAGEAHSHTRQYHSKANSCATTIPLVEDIPDRFHACKICTREKGGGPPPYFFQQCYLPRPFSSHPPSFHIFFSYFFYPFFIPSSSSMVGDEREG